MPFTHQNLKFEWRFFNFSNDSSERAGIT